MFALLPALYCIPGGIVHGIFLKNYRRCYPCRHKNVMLARALDIDHRARSAA